MVREMVGIAGWRWGGVGMRIYEWRSGRGGERVVIGRRRLDDEPSKGSIYKCGRMEVLTSLLDGHIGVGGIELIPISLYKSERAIGAFPFAQNGRDGSLTQRSNEAE